MTPLRQKMLDAMIMRGFAQRTQESYLYAVQRLATYYHCSPEKLDAAQIQRFFLYLVKERQLSPASCRLFLNGIIFLYRFVLNWEAIDLSIVLPKKPQRIPELLSRQEVMRILQASKNDKHHAILSTCYACGLRVSELVALQLPHIDGDRKVIRIEQSKGRKDRLLPLSDHLRSILRRYYQHDHPQTWFFFGRTRDTRLGISTAQKAFQYAKRQVGIRKTGGIHSLRHAYATHQLEAGVPIHQLQHLMGHNDIHTTMRYVHWNPSLPHNTDVDLLKGDES